MKRESHLHPRKFKLAWIQRTAHSVISRCLPPLQSRNQPRVPTDTGILGLKSLWCHVAYSPQIYWVCLSKRRTLPARASVYFKPSYNYTHTPNQPEKQAEESVGVCRSKSPHPSACAFHSANEMPSETGSNIISAGGYSDVNRSVRG